MSSVSISGDVRRPQSTGVVETNLRLVATCDGRLSVRRIRIESNDRCLDLRQKICSRLRSDSIASIPSPWDAMEIVAPVTVETVCREVSGDGWHARLAMSDFCGALDLRKPRDSHAASDLLQKLVIVALEQGGEYWWLSESTRHWYTDEPVATDGDVMLLPRLSVATCRLSDGRLGIASDSGHLLCTKPSVAQFLHDDRSKQRFEELRGRSSGRRGTLIYDTGCARRSKCYFHDFADRMTCASTGVIVVRGRRFGSLFDYYQREKPSLPIRQEDPVVSVSFEWGERPVLVAATLLRLRLRLDPASLPRSMRRLAIAPESRRSFSFTKWSPATTEPITKAGFVVSPDLWQPRAGETVQLTPPDLLFGAGNRVDAPTEYNQRDYQRYFRDREQYLRQHGVYRFNPAAPREITIVLPRVGRGWSLEAQDAYVDGVRRDLEQLTKKNFTLRLESAETAKDISRLLRPRVAGTCLVVFDDRELDGAGYYLLSDELREWTLKRATRTTVLRGWERVRSEHDPRRKAQAEQAWRDMIFHTVLDMLDQMGVIPFRIDQWPYEACLAIDVSEDRRYCALSFLICRDPIAHPGRDGLWRYLECWTKPDTRRETIECVQLADKIAGIPDALHGHSLSPLKSMLVLRDGHECGDEPQAIDKALDLWKKADVLAQGATVDVVDYHKRTVKDLRMWTLATGEVHNVLEGRAVFLDEHTALTSLTGAATLGRSATAEPLLLVARDPGRIRRAASGVFSLAQHNWLSPKKAYRDAQPMRDADVELTRRMAMEVRGLR